MFKDTGTFRPGNIQEKIRQIHDTLEEAQELYDEIKIINPARMVTLK